MFICHTSELWCYVIDLVFETCSVVLINCTVTLADGSKVVYEYKKNLPYDVIEKDCTVQVCRLFVDDITVMFMIFLILS